MIRQIIASGILVLVLINSACAAPRVNVKLHVVGDDNQPIPEANVSMYFLLTHGGNSFKGVTDSSGFIEGTDRGYFGTGVTVTKDGYYKSFVRTGRGNQNLTMLLREKKTPIAMYAKVVNLRLPEKNKTYGFDFEKGDLVKPYGSGVTSHMDIFFDGSHEDFWNYEGKVEFSFPNVNDGLYALSNMPENVSVSQYKFPYQAIENPYMNSLLHTKKRIRRDGADIKESTFSRSMLGYFFRINTEFDEKGSIVSANYGKIVGDVFFSAKKQDDGAAGFVKFTYYLNPTPNDRNVEFGKNLFKNLKHEEQVREP